MKDSDFEWVDADPSKMHLEQWSDFPRPIKEAKFAPVVHVVRIEYVDGGVAYYSPTSQFMFAWPTLAELIAAR